MSKFLQFALLALALQPLPALAQPDSQYGFPVTDTPPGDLPCHMVTSNRNTLNLGRLCGTVPAVRTTPSNTRQSTNFGGSGGATRSIETPRATRSFYTNTSRFSNSNNYAADEPPPLNPQLIIDPSLMPTYSGSRSSSGSSSGNCQFPWQRASDGSLCGGRAASER
jgi:hypothetical protein